MRREISSPAVAPRQPRLRSALVVLVVAAPPEARLVAPLRWADEPPRHAPRAVQSARMGGIGVVDDAVLERTGRPLGHEPVARPRTQGAQRDGPLVAPPRRVRQALSEVVVVVAQLRDWRSHDAWLPSELPIRRFWASQRCSSLPAPR